MFKKGEKWNLSQRNAFVSRLYKGSKSDTWFVPNGAEIWDSDQCQPNTRIQHIQPPGAETHRDDLKQKITHMKGENRGFSFFMSRVRLLFLLFKTTLSLFLCIF